MDQRATRPRNLHRGCRVARGGTHYARDAGPSAVPHGAAQAETTHAPAICQLVGRGIFCQPGVGGRACRNAARDPDPSGAGRGVQSGRGRKGAGFGRDPALSGLGRCHGRSCALRGSALRRGAVAAGLRATPVRAGSDDLWGFLQCSGRLGRGDRCGASGRRIGSGGGAVGRTAGGLDEAACGNLGLCALAGPAQPARGPRGPARTRGSDRRAGAGAGSDRAGIHCAAASGAGRAGSSAIG